MLVASKVGQSYVEYIRLITSIHFFALKRDDYCHFNSQQVLQISKLLQLKTEQIDADISRKF